VSVVTASLLAGSTSLEPEQAVKKVPTDHKVVALTFDDGPCPGTTPALLAILKARQVKATFFVLGEQVEKYPQLAAQIVNEGHELGSHSYTHRHLNSLSQGELEKELNESEKVFASIGSKPTLIRPPGGGYNDRLVRELKQRGYTTVLWSIDPRDWDHRSTQQIIDSVLGKVKPGAIILLHEGKSAPSTPAAVEVIIDRLRADGYNFITVSDLLQYYEIR